MASISIEGRRQFYRLEGEDGKPVLVLAHPIGADHGIWDQVVPALSQRFQILRYDLRGHGGSDATAGVYSVDMLADDMIALTSHLGIGAFSVAGISLGALAALSAAIRHPERIKDLVLANVAARLPLTPEQWNGRIALAHKDGMGGLAGGMAERMFSAPYKERNAPYMHSVVNSFKSTGVEGYASALAALRDVDLRGRLSDVQARTLVVGGADDAAIPRAELELLASGIAGARLEMLPGGHLTPVEVPQQFIQAVMGFLRA